MFYKLKTDIETVSSEMSVSIANVHENFGFPHRQIKITGMITFAELYCQNV
jgi:hypothetical protein